MNCIVEIHAAEGGDDAKLLVEDQFSIYWRLCQRHGCDIALADKRPGLLVFRVTGDSAASLFKDEPGGHRWQRIPPTERSGRVHTSTITVAVFPEVQQDDFTVKESDLEWTTTRGSGPGGQNVNKVETVAVVKHKPSGLMVRSGSERSQHRNKELARQILYAKLKQRSDDAAHATIASDRRGQVGSGMRGDKRRTIRTQDGIVKDHITGRQWRYADYSVGKW